MQTPWITKELVPASGSVVSPGDVALVRARTLSVTARVKFHGSGDTDATVYLYYSPDGKNWDTIPYASFALAVSAGAYVQRTVPIDLPEHGYIKAKLTNGDSSYAITEVKAWYAIQSWTPYRGLERGAIRADVGEETRGAE